MSKTKTFITVIPLQGKNKDTGKDLLQSVKFEPNGNSRLSYDETRFPLIPALNGYTEQGDKIRVIAVVADCDEARHNFDTYFKKEVAEIVRKKSLSFTEIEKITTSTAEDIDKHIKLFLDIINKIGDDEEIYACTTFGSKPISTVETMALNYAYKLKNNVSIGCIVYGKNYPKPSEIFDVTALFFTNAIVEKLAEMKVNDPEKAIKSMLAAGGGDE